MGGETFQHWESLQSQLAIRASGRDGTLPDAIREAQKAGIYLPQEWLDLAHFATLFPRWEKWQTAPAENLGKLFQMIIASVRSSHSALAWSGWFVLVETFHRIQGVLKSPDTCVQKCIADFVKTTKYVRKPNLLYGAQFECELLWLGVEHLKILMAQESSGGVTPSLRSVLGTSKHATNVLKVTQPNWHPGRLILVTPFREATEDLIARLNGAWVTDTPRVVAAEFQIAPYLNAVHDFAIWIAKLLPDAAYYDAVAPVDFKRKALELSGLWAITAWEALRGRRLWEERRNEQNGVIPLPLLERETRALDLAVKGFRAAGLEHTAAALASLLTSYVLTNRDLKLTGVRGEASSEERENRFRRLRTKHGQLIRQLGFEIVKGNAEVSPEAEALEQLIRKRKEGVPKERVLESLHESVAYASTGNKAIWKQLLSLIADVPCLRAYKREGRKLPLLHALYHALVAEEDYNPLAEDLPPLTALGPELEMIRVRLVPILFHICIMQWRLRWAARLLTLGSSGLNGSHFVRFLERWKFALASAPEFVAPQTEFHRDVRSALSRHCDGRHALDDNEYFGALELLHSPVLTLLDTQHCSADELFNRWLEENLHQLALETVNRKRIGLRGGRGTKHKPAVRIPSFQKMTASLADMEHRTGHRVVWVSFVVAGTEKKPEVRGMTLRADHTSPRWREELDGASLEADAKEYIDKLGVAIQCESTPIELEGNSSLLKLVDAVINQIGAEANGDTIVLLSGPPELNSLPWRWLLHSRAGACGSKVPAIFIVPSASWLVAPRFAPIRGKVTVRTGHGAVAEMAAGFNTTVVVPAEQERGLDAEAHFAELRRDCENHETVVDNRCFAGQTDRYRTCEWSGNPAMLLMTPCRLLVAPPCEIPVSTANEFTRMVKMNPSGNGPLGLVSDLDALASRDSAAWVYNLYGAP